MRSLLRVGLRPSRTSRVSLRVQLVLVSFWLIYAVILLLSDNATTTQLVFYYIFLGLGVLYLMYILALNTPIFGQQSYLEITDSYLVIKKGHFRKKLVVPFQEVETMQVNPTSLRVTCQHNMNQYIDLRPINNKKDLLKVKEQLQAMAQRYKFMLSENTKK